VGLGASLIPLRYTSRESPTLPPPPQPPPGPCVFTISYGAAPMSETHCRWSWDVPGFDSSPVDAAPPTAMPRALPTAMMLRPNAGDVVVVIPSHDPNVTFSFTFLH
jgi:hypothetical protein